MQDDERVSRVEIVNWLELGCWTLAALSPFLYWVNGRAVSSDQFVVRTAVVAMAFTGAMTIRLVKWIRKRQ
jgi:hypothetical protein